jgi:hypothetical protein
MFLRRVTKKRSPLQKEQRLWETIIDTITRENAVTFENIGNKLFIGHIKSKTNRTPLEGIVQQTSRNLMTLDLQQKKLIPGASWTRDALLRNNAVGINVVPRGNHLLGVWVQRKTKLDDFFNH